MALNPNLGRSAYAPTPTEFGTRLRKYRGQAGLSQRTLAIRAGVTHSYVSRLESGDREPSMTALAALIESLDLSPTEALALLPKKLRTRLTL